MSRDRCTGVIAATLGIVIAAMTANMQVGPVVNDAGPKVFPYITSLILMACGALLALKKDCKEEKPFLKDRDQLFKLVTIAGLIIIYAICEDFFGFVIPSAVFLLISSKMFSRGAKIPFWHLIIYSLGVTGVVYLLFSVTLKIVLPTGKLI